MATVAGMTRSIQTFPRPILYVKAKADCRVFCRWRQSGQRHGISIRPNARRFKLTRADKHEANAERLARIVLETIFSHLDLASMCLGTPTLANGFIDVDMQTIMRDSGLGQRRCERAIAMLKEAGFMKVTQSRTQNEEGAYFGCRAIRVVTETLFDWLGFGPMLQQERARASERLRHKAQKASKKLSDLMRRMKERFKSPVGNLMQHFAPRHDPNREKRTLAWNRKWGEFTGMEICSKYLMMKMRAGFSEG